MATDLTRQEYKAPLRNSWYHVMPSHRLKTGKIVGRVILGEPIVVGRADDGKVFALRDICPHRALPLSCGRFDGRELQCYYHGWRFATSGHCTSIPSLANGQEFPVSRIRANAYTVREVQRNIWVWIGEPRESYPEIPSIPEIGDLPIQVDISLDFTCAIDEAVISFFDLGHAPHIHSSWWYRSRRPPYEKEKLYTPQPYGFRMERFASKANGLTYRVLGGNVSTEITFHLPATRIEHLKAGDHTLCTLTTATPTEEGHVQITHSYYWTMPWLTPLRPFIKHFSTKFLMQDHKAMADQGRGLKYDPPMMLVDDIDMPAKWYYRLKREFLRSEGEQRPFENPVRERVLRYKT